MAIDRETLRLLRQLATTVGGHADETTHRLTEAWVRAWDELTPAWQSTAAEVVTRAIVDGHWPAPWQLARIERLAAAVAATSTALDGLAAQAGATIADCTGAVVAATAVAEPVLIASQLPAALATAAAAGYAVKLTPTALDVIVRRTGEQVTALTRPLSADATDAMRRSLGRGVALGDNLTVVARDMVRRVEGDFKGGLTRAITIARTEILNAYRTTSRYAHTVNAEVLASWTWHSTLDARTCQSCWAERHYLAPRLNFRAVLGNVIRLSSRGEALSTDLVDYSPSAPAAKLGIGRRPAAATAQTVVTGSGDGAATCAECRLCALPQPPIFGARRQRPFGEVCDAPFGTAR
ncbi:hypothetical protein [Micromonospora sp. DPT]|uniref:hypothetical protein n=1 Tax=Micromonospora sp. DPT TaxID=3142975 RepID=UPI00320AF131